MNVWFVTNTVFFFFFMITCSSHRISKIQYFLDVTLWFHLAQKSEGAHLAQKSEGARGHDTSVLNVEFQQLLLAGSS